jgi:hypothetical protein
MLTWSNWISVFSLPCPIMVDLVILDLNLVFTGLILVDVLELVPDFVLHGPI